MNQPDSLDTKLRDKLKAAADSELPARATEQQVATLTQQLVNEAKLGKTRGLRYAFALGGVAAAAAALLAVSYRAQVEPAVQPIARCGLPVDVKVSQQSSGAPRIALGTFGTLAGSSDAQLSVVSADPCMLRVHLASGVIAGDLSNLRPAQLRIGTKFGDVVVRGTRFSVAARDELEVVLLSGKVEVTNSSGAPTMLAPQQTLRATKHDRRLSKVEPTQSGLIDVLMNGRGLAVAQPVGAEPLPPPPAVSDQPLPNKSSAELLAKAERERKAGALAAARTLYAAASRFGDDDAEVALLRWARLELSDGQPVRASSLLVAHTKRFRRGKLGAEAAWLNVDIMRTRGEGERAQRGARQLIEKYPGTPQADAARAYLSTP